MASRRDDITARRLRLAGAAADVAIGELREDVCDAVIAFVSAVAPDLHGVDRLNFAVLSLRSIANGLAKAGVELLREEDARG